MKKIRTEENKERRRKMMERWLKGGDKTNKMNNTQKNYETLSEAIKTNNISVEELLDAFTNWHGLQILSDDFMEFM